MGTRRSETKVRSGGNLEGAREQVMNEIQQLLVTY